MKEFKITKSTYRELEEIAFSNGSLAYDYFMQLDDEDLSDLTGNEKIYVLEDMTLWTEI